MNEQLLKELVDVTKRILAVVEGRAGSHAAPAKAAGGAGEIPVAPEDDKYDPKVFRSPKGWQGENYEGRTFSETCPEFLEQLASSLWGLADWQDGKDKRDKHGNPSSAWTRKDASRARRWALRLREKGRTPAPKSNPVSEFMPEMDDIPF